VIAICEYFRFFDENSECFLADLTVQQEAIAAAILCTPANQREQGIYLLCLFNVSQVHISWFELNSY
jgi:hypothetical protein